MKHFSISLRKSLWIVSAICLGTVSCQKEWDDHYSTDYQIVPGSTLAERLSDGSFGEDAQLFLEILDNTYFTLRGAAVPYSYLDFLDDDQFLTVWVPKASSLTDEERALYTKKNKTYAENVLVANRFILNHVARFSHPVGRDYSEEFFMMSKKRYQTEGNSIDDVPYNLDKSNIACKNGIIHSIDGKLVYRQSIYEYLTTSDEYKDVIGDFFEKYTREEVDINRSVEEDIDELGRTVYSDSVIIKRNVLLDRYGYIEREDSNYVMVIPTPQVWSDKYDSITKFFDYGYVLGDTSMASVMAADSLKYYWGQQILLTDMVFNMNLKYNKNDNDSVVSTRFRSNERKKQNIAYHTYYNPNSAEGLFKNHVVRTEKCSNGRIYITDEWPFVDSLTINVPIKIEGENAQIGSKQFTDPIESVYRNSAIGKISEEKVLYVIGKDGAFNWFVEFPIKDNLKGKYRIKIALVPDISSKKPNLIHPTVTYNKITIYDPKDPNNPRKDWNFENNTSKVDTLDLGIVDVPYCDYKTESSRLTLRLASKMTNSNAKNYSSVMRLDFILLEPVLDE